MIDINKEAKELFPINSTKGRLEMLSRHQLNNSLKQEGFKKAFESKSFQARVLQAKIDLLLYFRNTFQFSMSSSIWKDILIELQQQLKELENEI